MNSIKHVNFVNDIRRFVLRTIYNTTQNATIRKFHKRLTRNPADETIEFIRLWVDNERELDAEVEEEEIVIALDLAGRENRG